MTGRRILMTADPIGGVWTYVVELARALGRRGVSVVLAVMGAPLSRAQHADIEEVSTVTVHERPYKLEWMHDPWTDVDDAGAWLVELEDQLRPDCVHVNGFAHGALPFHAGAVVVAHSCCASWWQAVHREPPPDTPAMRTYMERVSAGLRGARAVVAPTGAMWRALGSIYGHTHDPVIISNARTPEVPTDASTRKSAFVCGIGRLWDAAKNLALLDAAAPGLSWPVRLAGSDTSPDGQRLALEHAESLGVLDSDDVIALLRKAAVYALPARYEPFGLSVLEAAREGCALVLGDIPSLRELWSGAAVFVDPDDVDGLHAAIARLIEDAPGRRSLARRAHARSLAEAFDPDVQAERYLELYDRVRARQAA